MNSNSINLGVRLRLGKQNYVELLYGEIATSYYRFIRNEEVSRGVGAQSGTVNATGCPFDSHSRK